MVDSDTLEFKLRIIAVLMIKNASWLGIKVAYTQILYTNWFIPLAWEEGQIEFSRYQPHYSDYADGCGFGKHVVQGERQLPSARSDNDRCGRGSIDRYSCGLCHDTDFRNGADYERAFEYGHVCSSRVFWGCISWCWCRACRIVASNVNHIPC